MQFETAAAPHIPSQQTVANIMGQVLLALVPGVLAMAWFFGVGVFVNLILGGLTAVAAEAAILALRKRPVIPALKDLSALVTAALLAVSLPVIAPWWIVVLGSLFAIIIVKHLYGGLGYNLFNPAMAGYVFLLISFPKHMTGWLTPDSLSTVPLSFAETFDLIFNQQLPPAVQFDAVTMATPLDALKTQLGLHQPAGQILQGERFGWLAGKGWEWVALAYLAGGIKLMRDKLIAWQIPCGMLSGLVMIATVCYLSDSGQYASPFFHLFAGGTMLGAFFIATDPVTAATSANGRLVFGALIGVLVYIIRVWGGYPDGIAFAVLLANLSVPAIDQYTKPRVFGQKP